jgi:hypothetical protein
MTASLGVQTINKTSAAHAAKRVRSCGFLKSTGVPLGMIPVGLTRVIE